MLHYEVMKHPDNHKDPKEWIMLLHGLGGSTSIWYKQIPELKKHYNLILPDFYGHGNSNKKTLPVYTFQGLADAVVKVLDDLEIDRVHLMGISMGSSLGCFIAVYQPHRIKSMILGGAALGMDTRTTILLHAGNILKYVMPYMWIYGFFAWIMMPRKNHAKSRAIFVREARKLGGKEFRKWYRLLMKFPLYQLELESPTLMEIPKLFISGSQDHLFLKQVVDWSGRDPNAVLHIIEGQGHLCNIEWPEEFNQACINYIDGRVWEKKQTPNGPGHEHGSPGDKTRVDAEEIDAAEKRRATA